MIDTIIRYSSIIKNYDIIVFEEEKDLTRLKLEIFLVNGSVLFVIEYLNFKIKKRKYSFHWVNSKKELLIRWDNAPHYKHMKTFPDHKRTGDLIEESPEVTLEDVLNEIKKNIKK